MEKPDVDQIDGLSPAISIDQKGASRNPRSTVGTVTEIYDHLRLLFARVGHPHCPNGHEIERQSVPQIVDKILALPDGVAHPRPRPAHPRPQDGGRPRLRGRAQAGLRARPRRRRDARPRRGPDARQIQAAHDRGRRRPAGHPPRRRRRQAVRRRPIQIRTAAASPTRSRPLCAWARASSWSRPRRPETFEEQRYSEKYSCPFDGYTIDELEPRSFSFNSPHGACPACTGLGVRMEFDAERVINRNLSVSEGALLPWSRMTMTDSWYGKVVEAVAKRQRLLGRRAAGQAQPEGPRLPAPLAARREGAHRLPAQGPHELLRGDLRRAAAQPRSDATARRTLSGSRQELEKFMVARPCPTCRRHAAQAGSAVSVTVDGLNIAQVSDAVGDGLTALGGSAAQPAVGARAPDRAPGAEGDPVPPRLPGRRRAWTT